MRRRVLIARFGLVAAALVVVWVILDARASTSSARRQVAEQADPTRPGSLAYRLAEAESSRAELVAQLAATRGDVEGLGRQVDKLPTAFPTPAPAAAPRVIIVRPPDPPAAPSPSPTPTSSAAPKAPTPSKATTPPAASKPRPTATPRPCVPVLGVEVCPGE